MTFLIHYARRGTKTPFSYVPKPRSPRNPGNSEGGTRKTSLTEAKSKTANKLRTVGEHGLEIQGGMNGCREKAKDYDSGETLKVGSHSNIIK